MLKCCQTTLFFCQVYRKQFFSISRINIMNGKLEAVVLDNRYYAGGCLPNFIQDVRFRKPYNLQQYTIEACFISNHGITLLVSCFYSRVLIEKVVTVVLAYKHFD